MNLPHQVLLVIYLFSVKLNLTNVVEFDEHFYEVKGKCNFPRWRKTKRKIINIHLVGIYIKTLAEFNYL